MLKTVMMLWQVATELHTLIYFVSIVRGMDIILLPVLALTDGEEEPLY